MLVLSELAADESDDSSVGDDDMASYVEVGEEGVDTSLELGYGFASGSDEWVKVAQRPVLGC